ncbi:AEC family transporter [Aliarcobacter butzleri]|uniref:AEC family transporter n=1 Tax=Aliarcobacter butzleri TaxID=28197 RepID=UPI00125F4283|nr:AEC family transporter [Aliarcobacter butzleri]MCT7562227.1 AEC family transporter [Aliarcobacter butzleri]MCT7627232.1 AEC family transporter [Aliarcobacter butzleri]UWY61170.1 AEC family transporter [Aliarcobacter butzleri]
MENFILIILAMSIGYTINRLNIFSKDAPLILNQFLIYISLPAMILLQIPKLDISIEAIIPIIISWTVMILSALLILFLSKIFDFSKEVTGCLMLVTVLGNTSFIGIPIITSYMGEEAIPYILVYDQLGNFIALATYGTFIASFYSSNTKVTFRLVTFKVLTFPPFIALIVGLLLIGTEFNDVTIKVLSAFSSTIVPLALVAVGLQLQLKLLKEEIKPFSVALIIKLLIAPLIAIIICKIFGWHNTAATVSIMEAAMPTMITAGAIASMAGLAPKLSSAIVGYGTIISLFTTGLFYFIANI